MPVDRRLFSASGSSTSVAQKPSSSRHVESLAEKALHPSALTAQANQALELRLQQLDLLRIRELREKKPSPPMTLPEVESLEEQTTQVGNSPRLPRSGNSAKPPAESSARINALYRGARRDFRTVHGVLHQRQIVARPPVPRSAEERRRGLEIQRNNIQAARTSPLRSRSPKVGNSGGTVGRSRSDEEEDTTRAKLHHVATEVSHQIEVQRQKVEEKQKRSDEIEVAELRKQIFPHNHEVEQLVLRICAWHVTIMMTKQARSLQETFNSLRMVRQEQIRKNERATFLIARFLFPPVRRWVRRMRLRRLVRAMFAVLFAVKVKRVHQHHCADVVRKLLKILMKDRSYALHRFRDLVHRSMEVTLRTFRCRVALRTVLSMQWMAMESSLLLFHFESFPDITLIPGWADEHSALRLKLLHTAKELPPLPEMSLQPMPKYLNQILKWRYFFCKYRPVGVFEETHDRLPRSLSILRVPSHIRQRCIEDILDREYDFQRQQVLDARMAIIKRKRNLEEWKERQKHDIVTFVSNHYSMNKDSKIFSIACEYLLERRVKDAMTEIVMPSSNLWRQGTTRNMAMQRREVAQMEASTSMRVTPRMRLFDEHALNDAVVAALNENVMRLRKQPSLLGVKRASVFGPQSVPSSIQASLANSPITSPSNEARSVFV